MDNLYAENRIKQRRDPVETDSPQLMSQTLYLSLICHWLLLLDFTGKAKHGLWLSIPLTGALADPPAVILDFMSTVPENQPQQ